MKTHSTLVWLVSAATIAGALLLASCTPSSPATTETSTTSTKPQGTLKIALDFHNGTPWSSTSKFFATGNTYQALGAPMFDGLVEPSPDGQIIPGLAERWEISSDGKTHTFNIRKGVKFHNGDDLTAEDVKFTITDGVLDPGSTGSEGSAWRRQVKSVEVKDPYTVMITMNQPQFELLEGMPNFMGSAAVLPKKYIQEKGWDYFTKNPIGSGPWKFVSHEANTRLELEANEDHWRAKPKFKNVTLLSIKEESSKVAMLKTGELDIAPIMADSVAGVKAAGIRIQGHYGGSQAFSWPLYDLDNPQSYALGDIRVRKALSLAVDRKELAEKLYGGYAQPSFLFFVPRTAFFYDANTMKPDPYDAEGAKRLLAEAGYPNGFSTVAWDAGGGGATSMLTQALVGYWRKIGINAEIVAIERTVALNRFSRGILPEAMNKIWTYSSGGGIYHFERVRTTCRSDGSGRNMTRSLSDKLDPMVDKVSMLAEGQEKTRLAQEVVKICKDEFATLTYLDIDDIFAIGPKIGQFTPTKGMHGLGWDLDDIPHPK